MARNFADEERRELLDRMEGWAQRLKQDRSLPWVGMGLIKDLELVIEHLGGTPAPERPAPAAPELVFNL